MFLKNLHDFPFAGTIGLVLQYLNTLRPALSYFFLSTLPARGRLSLPQAEFLHILSSLSGSGAGASSCVGLRHGR